MKNIVIGSIILLATLFFSAPSFSHCEIPCGIYGDAMRMDMIAEHIQTIKKSMNMIIKLSQEKEVDQNQLVRWVMNKEKHAEALQNIIWQYFIAQRIKPVDDEKSAKYKTYIEQITLSHKLIIYAMKAKQSTDLAHISALEKLLAEFKTAYMTKK
ncbi:superoxide dismutase [Ni] [candidate division CSSED10-310 bacterium]|uniref:Superoxide dismutase [Ni] n=1 Tax=candidate division CSSED10-310 bacterium TaxID=2855610 RepID=A0ABV6Z645_UNCC1